MRECLLLNSRAGRLGYPGRRAHLVLSVVAEKAERLFLATTRMEAFPSSVGDTVPCSPIELPPRVGCPGSFLGKGPVHPY